MVISYFSRLRVRLMMLLLACAVLGLGVIANSHVQQRNTSINNLKNEMKLHLQAVEYGIQRLLSETRRRLLLLPETAVLKQTGALARGSCQKLLRRMRRSSVVTVNIAVLDDKRSIVCSAVPMQGSVGTLYNTYVRHKSGDSVIREAAIRLVKLDGKSFLLAVRPFYRNKGLQTALLMVISVPVKAYSSSLPPGSVLNIPATNGRGSVSRAASAVKKSGGKGVLLIEDPDGVERLYVYSRIPGLSNKSDTYISISIATSHAYEQANAELLRNFIVLLLLTLIVVTVSWVGGSRLVLRGVKKLLFLTREVGAGNYKVRYEEGGAGNEIDNLGKEFNKMAGELEFREVELKKTNELLVARESELKNIIETVPDIIYSATQNTGFEFHYISPGIEQLTGYTAEELYEKRDLWLSCIHVEDKNKWKVATGSGNGEYDVIYRIWHRDGITQHWLRDCARIVDDSSNVKQISGVISDITQAKHVEMLSGRLGRILEESTDEIYVFNANTLRFVDVSSGALSNIGYSIEDMENLTPLDIIPEYTYEHFTALINPLILGEKQHVVFEAEHQRKDGMHYPVEVRIQYSDAEKPPVFIAIVQDISDRKKYMEEIEHNALHDLLTGLPNRMLLHDRVIQSIRMAHRESKGLGICVIDVMRLSEVNDTLGYETGNKVLKEVASRLVKMLRESDTVARLEGDEFALVLPGLSMMTAQATAGKVLDIFGNLMTIDDTPLEIEAVLGISLYPDHGSRPEDLLQKAGIATHVAKSSGERFSLYSADESPFGLRKLRVFGELRSSIDNGEMDLYFQPQISVADGSLVAVEALARWLHGPEGVIMPDEFIPMIEHSGLMKTYTYWVLEKSLSQLEEWASHDVSVKLAVNLSSRNLLDDSLPAYIANLLQKHNLTSDILTLEVTEAAAMSAHDASLKVLEELHEMGISLSIDDFGSGYSSLSHLKKLPMDELKIDCSFISGLAGDKDDAALVRSIIEMAKSLGMKVVAEGVEDKETLDILASYGCDIVQGFYLANTMSVDDLEAWMSEYDGELQ
jgi:diguanylate cyclase (GGDEF)-like protein/PAS domain S-box-containing protein